ncbi:MAG TPA: cytochrome P450 [Candidatus Limnocylindrales bacterium]|nr:cytochrome P450 [Candidatus Limnocylindrales bacterium]
MTSPAASPLLLERYTTTVEFSEPAAIREALLAKDLSRSFDKRTYEQGNVRDGVVSIVHGATHRARRRIENTEFRPDRLRLYERELFPMVLERILDRETASGRADLFPLGALISVVLAARRAGLDIDPDDRSVLQTLVHDVEVFSQASAILDAKDPDAVRRLARETLADFERDFVRPAWETRRQAIEAAGDQAGSGAELPHDILTVLLLHRTDGSLELEDDGRVVREVATYLQGGTHTSAQTIINTLDLAFPLEQEQPGVLTRIVADRAYAQRCVHETLRLRPTTPKIKRRAEAETVVAGRAIPRDALVILDVATANRDPALYGDRPDAFDPDRAIAPDAARWGLSFGGGPHQCPGRSVAGGFPATTAGDPGDDHLYGLIALMLQAVVRRGVRPDPDRPPARDTRTERYTRWSSYPVVFGTP